MKRKVFSIVLAMILVMSVLPTFVLAESVANCPGECEHKAAIGTTHYDTLADAVAAAAEGQTVEIIAAGTYKIPAIPKNITIKGVVSGAAFDCGGSGSIASIPNGATFENVSMTFGNNAYHGFQHAGTINMKDCTLNGLLFSYGDMNFTGCTFVQETSEYNMWCYGEDCTFTDCTFNSNGKFLNVYNEGNGGPWTIKADGCTFNSSNVNKAAFNVKETCGPKLLKYNVIVDNCSCNENFPTAKKDGALIVFSPLIQVDDMDQTGAESGLSVKLDGKQLYPSADASVSIEEAVFTETEGKTVIEVKDEEGRTEEDPSEEAKAAIIEVISNAAVADVETKIEEAVSKDKAEAIAETVVEKDETLANFSAYVNITPISASVSTVAGEEKTTIVREMTFDVQPMLAVTVIKAGSEPETKHVKVENEAIESEKEVAFRLPIDKNAPNVKAQIFHVDEDLGYFDIKGDAINGKYVELSLGSFSEVTVKLTEVPGDTVASITSGENTWYYQSLGDAIAAVRDGETIKLMTDSNAVSSYEKAYGENGYSEAAGANRLIIGADSAKNFTLDLNGKTLTGRINFLHGSLTIKNGKLLSSSQAVNIFGSKNYEDKDKEYTVVTIAEDVEIKSDGYGVAVFGGNPDNTYWPLGFGEVVNVYAKITAPVGIGNSGNIGMDTYEANIGKNTDIENLVAASDCESCSELMIKYGPALNFYDGAEINAEEEAVYWPGLGRINVMGGSVTGTEAISIKGGIVNVSGGMLKATGPKCDPVQAVNSNAEPSGATLSVSTTYNENYPIKVNISGGTLESVNNSALLVIHSVKNGEKIRASQGIDLAISGGMFRGGSTLGAVYVEPALEGEEGKYPSKFISAGYFNSDPTAYLEEGKIAVASDKPGFNFMVEDKQTTDVQSDVNSGTSQMKEDDNLSGTTAGEVVNEIKNNTDVVGTDSLVPDARKIANDSKVMTESKKDEATQKLSDAGISVSDTVTVVVEPYFEIAVTSAEAVGTSISSVTFDIDARYNLIATTAEDPSQIEKEDPVSRNAIALATGQALPVTQAVALTLPLPESFIAEDGEEVYVIHVHNKGQANEKTYVYKGIISAEGAPLVKTVSFTNPNGFSEFTVVKEADTAASIERGGDTMYFKTVAAAVAEVQDAETIKLETNAAIDAVVSREVSFTLDKNGKTASGSITAGTNYKNTGSGKNYIFVYVAPTHTDVIYIKPAAKDEEINIDFTDIPEDAYYHDAVYWAASKGITKGMSNDCFAPDALTTRSQFVTFLWRAAGKPEPVKAADFKDVSAGAGYAKAVAWANEKGITNGTGNGNFSPDTICDRSQIVTLLARFAGIKDADLQSGFYDVKSADYFAAAVKWAKDQGITKGASADRPLFYPYRSCSRAEAITFLYRYMVK